MFSLPSIFKALVCRCVDELRHNAQHPYNNSHSSHASEHGCLADSLLTAVYRYLCGYGNGLLADPLLHRLVYTLMSRLFWRLVKALRELGARIVYADFSRVILATPHLVISIA
jgi:hypothetical protein